MSSKSTYVKSKINLIPPDKIEELRKMLDEGTLSYRQAEIWVYKEFKIIIGYKTIERWKTGKITYKYGFYEEPKPTDKVKGTKASRTSRAIIKKAINTSKVTEFSAKRRLAGEEVKKVSKSKSNKVVTSDKVDVLAPGPRKETYKENITFKANDGPQTTFLAAPETDVLYGGSAGGGKVVQKGDLISTPFGWKAIEDVAVGDLITNPSGGVQKIIQLHPWIKYTPTRVSFSDGTYIDVHEGHLWQAWRGRKGNKKQGKRIFGYESREVVETRTLRNWLERGYNPQIPVTKPVVYNTTTKEQNRVDDYLLGVLLGDGCITTPNLTISAHEDDQEHLAKYLTQYGDDVVYKGQTVRFRGKTRSWLVDKLKLHGLLGKNSKDKFIPKSYKYAPISNRLELIRGLMDTDGYLDANKNGTYYVSVSKTLATDVAEILRGLGCVVTVTTKTGKYRDKLGEIVECSQVHQLYIKSRNDSLLFNMERKKSNRVGKEEISKRVVSVDLLEGEVEGRCITVSGIEGTYCTNDFIVTHNSMALIVDPLRSAGNPKHRALILRRSLKELRQLIDMSRDLYPKAYPGARFKEAEKLWVFPSGSRIEFGYLEKDADVYQYQGQDFSLIAFDEISQLPTEFPWHYLASRLRTSVPSLKVYMRCTTNPGGPGHCDPYGEVLTKEGWESIQNIQLGDLVLSQTTNGELLYKKVVQLHEYDSNVVNVYEGSTYHIACTSEHQIPVVTETKNKDGRVFHPYILRKEKDLSNVTRLPEVGRWYGSTPATFYLKNTETRKPRLVQPTELNINNYVKLLGWYLSEGCTIDRDKAFVIAQKKVEERELIKHLLLECGFKFRENSSSYIVYSKSWYDYFKQFGKSRDKFIPPEVKQYTASILELLIETLMLGDGCNGVYYTISKQLADDMCEIGLKAGYKVIVRSRQRENRVGLSYEVSLKKNRKSWIEKKNKTVLPYEGKVRCIGVEDTHTFYIRQKGYVWLSGNSWVRKRYVDPAEPGTSFIGPDGISRRFIPARLKDNPYLFVDGRYQKMLESLPEVQRRQLLDGDWDIAEGMAFPEFQKDVHVVQPFDIPRGWNRFKACDYGFAAPSCVLWATADPSDGTIIVYKELYQKNLTGKELGDKIVELELEEFRDIPGVIDHSVFNRTGYAGPTIGEILNRPPYNLKFRPADKNRKAGKIQVHEYLRLNKDTTRPKLQIFSTCTNLIREISSITTAKSDPEDVDTDHDDHAYDALRYLLMSRPRVLTVQDKFLQMKKEIYTMRDPVYGY